MEAIQQPTQPEQENLTVQENKKQDEVEGPEPSKEEAQVNPDDAKLTRSE